MTIFSTPELDLEDRQVLEQIHAFRSELTDVLRVPRRWAGGLRRSMLARAIQGSNSIEGYDVKLDDAAAALDDEEALSADERTFAEIRGYRQALGYVLAMAKDADFRLDVSAVRGMHFMMLGHDLAKSPGSYRQGVVYVHDETSGENVYEGPPAEDVPGLVAELTDGLAADGATDPVVQAAMAHLNLVRDLQRGLEPPAGRSANHFEILISVSHFSGGLPNELITIWTPDPNCCWRRDMRGRQHLACRTAAKKGMYRATANP